MEKEFKEKIKQELKRYDMSLRAFVLGYDSWYIGSYLLSMRMAEYYRNKSLTINMLLLRIVNRWAGRKLGFQIHTTHIGFGIKIFHWGNIIINKNAKIGDNFCVYPGICIGRTADDGVPTIGNNVTFFTNSGAYGGIKIGNNVTVAPNAVVTHDVPDNCIVAGVPAKILRYKNVVRT